MKQMMRWPSPKWTTRWSSPGSKLDHYNKLTTWTPSKGQGLPRRTKSPTSITPKELSQVNLREVNRRIARRYRTAQKLSRLVRISPSNKAFSKVLVPNHCLTLSLTETIEVINSSWSHLAVNSIELLQQI